jgi:transcriptional regulator with XRE-family HTH domain
MLNIREVFASNLRKHRQIRGWSQAKLAEKTGTSTHYIGMLEAKSKFPSSEMIHKLASAMCIEPTELFVTEIPTSTILKNSKKAAFEDVGDAINHFISSFVANRIEELDTESNMERTIKNEEESPINDIQVP